MVARPIFYLKSIQNNSNKPWTLKGVINTVLPWMMQNTSCRTKGLLRDGTVSMLGGGGCTSSNVGILGWVLKATMGRGGPLEAISNQSFWPTPFSSAKVYLSCPVSFWDKITILLPPTNIALSSWENLFSFFNVPPTKENVKLFMLKQVFLKDL